MAKTIFTAIKPQRVVWHIGFDNKADFFRLHCPANNHSRLTLCEGAMSLLAKAWPHLTISKSLEDIEDTS